jgi:hypothetical protein
MPSAGLHPASLSLCAGWAHPGGVCPTFYNGVFDRAVRRLRPPHEPSPKCCNIQAARSGRGLDSHIGQDVGLLPGRERGPRLSRLVLTL